MTNIKIVSFPKGKTTADILEPLLDAMGYGRDVRIISACYIIETADEQIIADLALSDDSDYDNLMDGVDMLSARIEEEFDEREYLDFED